MLGSAWLVLVFPFAGSLLLGLAGRRMSPRAVGLVACGSVGLAFLFSLLLFKVFIALPPREAVIETVLFPWIGAGEFRTEIGFLLDPLSMIMLLVVTGVGFLIHLYAVGYMRGERDYPRFFAYLTLFMGMMLTVVLANNYLLLFLGWEGVGLCSYLLIGFWFEKPAAATAGRKAFIVNRVGDAGFLLGLFLLSSLFGSLRFTEVFAKTPDLLPASSGLITAVTLLLFVGAVGKSAQFPLHVWLPDAMEGPTPVSALIHAATMVTAGVYMVARSWPLYIEAPLTREVIAGIGVLTAFFAATIALTQNDIKRVIAYSTISQLGYMFVGLGVGSDFGAMFHLTTHAFFKALLFLGAGSVIHALHGEQDIRRMGGLFRHLPVTAVTFLLGALANAGVPPLSGFFSKDEILAEAFASGHTVVGVIALLTTFLTALYMFRLFFLVFAGESRVVPAPSREAGSSLHEPPWSMRIPLLLLAAATLLGGLLSSLLPFPVSRLGVEGNGGKGWEIPVETLSMGLALLGIGAAFLLYRWRMEWAGLLARRFRGLYHLLLNKYWVDELYRAFCVEPFTRWAIRFRDLWDGRVIDGAVNGLAAAVEQGALTLRRAQSGYVLNYIAAVVAGSVAIVSYLLLRS